MFFSLPGLSLNPFYDRSSVSGSYKNFLIVEDNPDERQLLEALFSISNLDMSLVFAENGEEAVNYLSRLNPYEDPLSLPALILTDLRMPLMDGLSLLAWIRQQPELKGIPVIVMSSTGDITERVRAEKLGISYYFVKPVDLNQLIFLVKAMLVHLREEQ
ncbi:response regulator [Kamptonema formosum]|uniref:response regulator n=1 Tax=Kamptonema formosum TaxID=331992 RepID=UPI00034C84A7|nr:response regulator [Oscillatoria sp. PCC 10802]